MSTGVRGSKFRAIRGPSGTGVMKMYGSRYGYRKTGIKVQQTINDTKDIIARTASILHSVARAMIIADKIAITISSKNPPNTISGICKYPEEDMKSRTIKIGDRLYINRGAGE
ncbi:MAG: hypothetical protein ACFFE6_08665 [Candidatus Thorarchaeota archaeon]